MSRAGSAAGRCTNRAERSASRPGLAAARALAALLLAAACAEAPPRPASATDPAAGEPAASGAQPQSQPAGLPAAPLGEGDAKRLADEAAQALSRGDDAQAEAALLRLVAARPDDAQASENLTRLRLKSGRLQLAAQDLAARSLRAPDSLPLQVQHARVLVLLGQLDQALDQAKQVLKTDERNVAALLVLADVWYRERKLELARDVLDNAAALDPRSAEVANAQGFVHLALEQKPLALEDFRRAAQLGPRLAEAHNNLGALYNEASDFEAATNELVLAAQIEPGRAAIWLNLGNAHRGARRFEEAEGAYRKALELEPAKRDALFNLGLLYLDGELKARPAAERLVQAQAFFQQFRKAGGTDARLARYEEEATRDLRKERDRLAREDRDKLKKQEAARKAEEALRKRESGKLGHVDEDEPAARPVSGKLRDGDEK